MVVELYILSSPFRGSKKAAPDLANTFNAHLSARDPILILSIHLPDKPTTNIWGHHTFPPNGLGNPQKQTNAKMRLLTALTQAKELTIILDVKMNAVFYTTETRVVHFFSCLSQVPITLTRIVIIFTFNATAANEVGVVPLMI